MKLRLKVRHYRALAEMTAIYFRKHCAVLNFLCSLKMSADVSEWVLVLDADTGVLNGDSCIDGFIDHRVQIIFYERFYNFEIAAGNYLIKNSEYSRSFLRRWILFDLEARRWLSSWDQGALHVLLLRELLPNETWQARATCERMWRTSRSWPEYFAFVSCCRAMIGARRRFHQIRILRRAHAWVIDREVLRDNVWCPRVFMIHGWKILPGQSHKLTGLTHLPKGGQCDSMLREHWPYRTDTFVDCVTFKEMLAKEERRRQRWPEFRLMHDVPFLSQPDVAECWPQCE